jgi:FkbH-like protein
VFLACGFEALHLETLLKGHLLERFPGEGIELRTGLYGDLEGNLKAGMESGAEAVAVVVEWSDADPRLGLRASGNWSLSAQDDIVNTAAGRLRRLVVQVSEAARRMPVAVVGPTLGTGLWGHTAPWQASGLELELERLAAEFRVEVARIGGVRVAHMGLLAKASPADGRLDAMMELKAGFPYTVAHASAVAQQLTRLLYPPPAMKGLITDLDETLWRGIVGEAGGEGVSWSLEAHAQTHGLYQLMLRHLGEMGVLLAVASKNEAGVVAEALQRRDLLVPGESFFPVCANWGRKSKSVGEILRVWNIGAESVVFVDDDPMELEEVCLAHPGITGLQFDGRNAAKTVALLEKLRELFGRAEIQREDSLRQASIRANAAMREAAGGAADEEFVRLLEGRVTLDCRKDPGNKRLLELINKTNQFNLNGRRLTDGEWMQLLAEKAVVVVGVGYEDKFGPLGTIGVLIGRREDGGVRVTHWVLSCRAFSRRIEDHMLDYLFRLTGAERVDLEFERTDRNAPLEGFLKRLGLTAGSAGLVRLERVQFEGKMRDLPHKVELIGHEQH